MKLLPNQLVKVMFRNGASVEGIVDIWDEDYVLRSIDGKSVLLIQDPVQDIMAVKIILEDASITNETNIETHGNVAKVKNTSQLRDNRQQQLKEISKRLQDDAVPTSMELRAKKLAELRLAAIAEEKRMVAEKLSNHTIGEVKPVIYGLPTIKIKSK